MKLLQDPDLARLLCSLKFVSKLGIANPDTTFCEGLKVSLFKVNLLLINVDLGSYYERPCYSALKAPEAKKNIFKMFTCDPITGLILTKDF